MTSTQTDWIARLTTLMRALGPYAAIELLLPGGSLIALLLWIFRHREPLAAAVRSTLSRMAALAAGFSQPDTHFTVQGERS